MSGKKFETIMWDSAPCDCDDWVNHHSVSTIHATVYTGFEESNPKTLCGRRPPVTAENVTVGEHDVYDVACSTCIKVLRKAGVELRLG